MLYTVVREQIHMPDELADFAGRMGSGLKLLNS